MSHFPALLIYVLLFILVLFLLILHDPKSPSQLDFINRAGLFFTAVCLFPVEDVLLQSDPALYLDHTCFLNERAFAL